VVECNVEQPVVLFSNSDGLYRSLLDFATAAKVWRDIFIVPRGRCFTNKLRTSGRHERSGSASSRSQ
jgi:hypothetical protein